MFTYDESVLISLKDLRVLGFFNAHERYKEAEINITRSNGLGNSRSTIQIAVSTQMGNSYLKLDFIVDGKQSNQEFEIVKKSNGLPKGFAWFVICPITNSNCTKLYFEGKTFKGKRSIKAGAYKIQLVKFGYKRNLCKKIESISKDQKTSLAM